MSSYPSIRIEGGLLGPDTLDQLAAGELPGQKPGDFGLSSGAGTAGRKLTDEIAAAFSDARSLWSVFQSRRQRLKDDDLGTTLTRTTLMTPFFGLLGYDLHLNERAYDEGGLSFFIQHRADAAPDAPPIHIVGFKQELGKLAESGRPRLSPHGLVQEFLNRTDHLWSVVTNGTRLRLLRDSTYIRRQSYIEFDLESMMEEQRFPDFAVLYRLLHRTRLPRGMADSADCLLEKYYQQSVEQGGRVRDQLRYGVCECIEILANGFLGHHHNEGLRARLASKQLSALDFYRQLLRIVYRFLFLLVAEDRGLLSKDPVYREHYGVSRLRKYAEQRAAYTEHEDIWYELGVLWYILHRESLSSFLALSPLNGELFTELKPLDSSSLANRELLRAFWHLSQYRENESAPWRRVNYAALDVEELGSVYESLLEYHPALDHPGAGQPPRFSLVFGSERKTTGSYYTPPELVNELIKSALDPVIEARLAAAVPPPPAQKPGERMRPPSAAEIAAQKQKKIDALLSIRVCDPACGSGHFLLAAARRIGKQLARVRSGEDEPDPEEWVRPAERDVIAHCIYGVDKNPLAVDLCRVALWIESHTKGKPLSFLDHHIRPGDSLVGVFDLACLNEGIPDKAFVALDGDDKAVARESARRNKEERAGQEQIEFDAENSLYHIGAQSSHVEEIADDTPEEVQQKKNLYEASHADPEWRRQKLACDIWTAAFFQQYESGHQPLATKTLFDHLGGRANAQLVSNAEALSEENQFFHWKLEFPEVFNAGGFDCILSNPPWVRQELFRPIKKTLSTYLSFQSTADLSVFFMELCVRMLAPSARAAILTPNKWFRASYGEELRKFLRKFAKLQLIIDFGHAKKLFVGVDTFPACTVFSRVEGGSAMENSFVRFVRANDEDRRELELSELIAKKAKEILLKNLSDSGWIFNDNRVDAIIGQMRANAKHLSEVVGSSPLYGIKTGLNDAFYLTESGAKEILSSETQSKDFVKPFIRGRDIKRWTVLWDHQWHIVIPSSQNRNYCWSNEKSESAAEAVFEAAHPKVFSHLRACKTITYSFNQVLVSCAPGFIV